ncbi:MAG: UDP-N-acetylmuramate dehydrogenase [Methylocystaceae bacterium]|nr:UDP-N-acetylmuramate dehydrogenase [Methylocystaceae bacterium]
MNTFSVGELHAFLTEQGVQHVTRDVSLAAISRWKIGGTADLLVEPGSTAEVATVMQAVRRFDVPVFVMGDGSNMLFDSRGFRGVILRIGRHLAELRIEGTRVSCGGGHWVPDLAMRLARRGLGGLEHIVGIPGTIGGLVLMNGGSQRKGVGEHVVEVTCVEGDGTIRTYGKDELDFTYRHSALQGRGAVITYVELELAPADPAQVRRAMIEIMASRRRKFPKNLPNCGSTFLSNPAMYEVVGPPGRAIEEAGFKGKAIGGAQVSPLHANFIVNQGNAMSDEVLALIALIRQTVHDRTGYLMDCEARFVTSEGEERPAHEFTDAKRFDTSLLTQVT